MQQTIHSLSFVEMTSNVPAILKLPQFLVNSQNGNFSNLTESSIVRVHLGKNLTPLIKRCAWYERICLNLLFTIVRLQFEDRIC